MGSTADGEIKNAPALRGLFAIPVVARSCPIPLKGVAADPAEAAIIAGAATRRQETFLAGRACARSCLHALGVRNSPVLRTQRGAPLWPEGIAGSISHSRTKCIAVAFRTDGTHSVGIDIEHEGAVSDELDELLFGPEERNMLATLQGRKRREAATLMFSAKEAFYKSQFPISGAFVDYREVSVEIASKRFTVTSLIDIQGVGPAGSGFDGNWYAADGHVVTAVTLRVPQGNGLQRM